MCAWYGDAIHDLFDVGGNGDVGGVGTAARYRTWVDKCPLDTGSAWVEG